PPRCLIRKGEQQSCLGSEAQATQDRVLQELDLRCSVLPPRQDTRTLAIHFIAGIVLQQDKAAMISIDSGLRSKCCNLINSRPRAGQRSRRRRATQPLRAERRSASHLGPMRSIGGLFCCQFHGLPPTTSKQLETLSRYRSVCAAKSHSSTHLWLNIKK
ncbi:hypothetical protein T310_10238, partial [Rasamsonia emersonii CBS 393.64]